MRIVWACLVNVSVLILVSLPFSARAQLQTSVAPTLPSLGPQDTEKPAEAGAGDPDSVYCRPPQRRTDSRLMGPKVCMTNRQWNDLHVGGFDIDANGEKVSMEKNKDMLSH
jgi:hypothetical protein